MRRLVSLRRRVPAERSTRYDALWVELRRLATERGAHAWRFASAEDPEQHLEFLEHRADADPRRDPEVAATLGRLEEMGAGVTEEWKEAEP